jgi:hypothetical protein
MTRQLRKGFWYILIMDYGHDEENISFIYSCIQVYIDVKWIHLDPFFQRIPVFIHQTIKSQRLIQDINLKLHVCMWQCQPPTMTVCKLIL